jgi:hypothetical protein
MNPQKLGYLAMLPTPPLYSVDDGIVESGTAGGITVGKG